MEAQCVPRKGLRSADCSTIYTIYLSFCSQSADPNPFKALIVGREEYSCYKNKYFNPSKIFSLKQELSNM